MFYECHNLILLWDSWSLANLGYIWVFIPGCWFQRFVFHPWEMIQFDEHVFQIGSWFNHHLVFEWSSGEVSGSSCRWRTDEDQKCLVLFSSYLCRLLVHMFVHWSCVVVNWFTQVVIIWACLVFFFLFVAASVYWEVWWKERSSDRHSSDIHVILLDGSEIVHHLRWYKNPVFYR